MTKRYGAAIGSIQHLTELRAQVRTELKFPMSPKTRRHLKLSKYELTRKIDRIGKTFVIAA